MPEQIRDELTDHEYDGIHEYDNPTPGWWHLIFFGTIVFSVCYAAVYHLSPAVPTIQEAHARAEAAALDRMFAEINEMPLGEEKILTLMAQPKWLEMGESIFVQQCALCHGQNGEGLVGPNLTDEYYKNTTSLGGIAEVVLEGAANGAMPAQKNNLNSNEIALVSAYVASLRGKNLPGPRGPEGEEIPAWPEPPSEDGAGGAVTAAPGEGAAGGT